MRASARAAICSPTEQPAMDMTKIVSRSQETSPRNQLAASPKRLKYSIDEILGRNLEKHEVAEKAPLESTERCELRKSLSTGGHL